MLHEAEEVQVIMPQIKWKICNFQCLTKLKLDITRARREFPTLFELIIALLVLCCLLLIGKFISLRPFASLYVLYNVHINELECHY